MSCNRPRLLRAVAVSLMSLLVVHSDAAPAPAETIPASFEIVKLDPNPARANETFAILVLVTSRVDRELVLEFRQNTQAIPVEKNFTLGPR